MLDPTRPRSQRGAAAPPLSRGALRVERTRSPIAAAGVDPRAVLLNERRRALSSRGAVGRRPSASIDSSTPSTSAVSVCSTSALGIHARAQQTAVRRRTISQSAETPWPVAYSGRVGVVQIGDLLVPLLGRHAAKVRTRHERPLAAHLDAPAGRRTPISGVRFSACADSRGTADTDRVPGGIASARRAAGTCVRRAATQAPSPEPVIPRRFGALRTAAPGTAVASRGRRRQTEKQSPSSPAVARTRVVAPV